MATATIHGAIVRKGESFSIDVRGGPLDKSLVAIEVFVNKDGETSIVYATGDKAKVTVQESKGE